MSYPEHAAGHADLLPASRPRDVRALHAVQPAHLPGVHARRGRRSPVRGVRARGGEDGAPAADRVRRTRNEKTTPVVTYTLIAINVVMFVLQTASPDLQSELVLRSPAVADGELYRLLTSAFLHYGITHLLFNMYALYVVGPPLEVWLGRLRFSALYALSALGGSVLVYLLSPLNASTAGASGAVFGLFGASFVVAKRLNLDVRWVVGLIVINLAFTFVIPLLGGQNISWQGHIGGLVTGALVAAAYAYAPRERRTLIQISATVALLVLFALLIWWRTTDLLTQFGVT